MLFGPVCLSPLSRTLSGDESPPTPNVLLAVRGEEIVNVSGVSGLGQGEGNTSNCLDLSRVVVYGE
eukprot:3334526-Prymnesium_polylepis.1